MVDHVAGQTLLTVIAVDRAACSASSSHRTCWADGVDAEVYHNALGFLRVQFLSLPLAFAYFCFQSQMRGVGQVTIPLYIISASVFINFVLDPLFIFYFGWGVVGAALATMVSQTVAATVAVTLLSSGRYGISLKLRQLRPDLSFIVRAFNLGYPAAIEVGPRACPP